MSDQNPYNPPKSKLSNQNAQNIEDNRLKGLGGWLILVGIGVVLSPIRLLGLIIQVYKPIFEDGTWEALTTVGSESYNEFWAPLLITEMIYNALMVIASLYLVYLFFTKNRFFPKFYILIAISSIIFIIIDAWLVTKVLPSEPMLDEETMRELTRALISAAIWVPYMLVSKRVKATFVEKKSNN